MKRCFVLWVCVGLTGWVHAGDAFLAFEGRPETKAAIQAFEDQDLYVPLSDEVRLCTYNIQDFWEGHEERERTWEHAHQQAQVAAAIIDEVKADVLILQEFESAEMVRLLNQYIEQPYAVGYITAFGSTWGDLSRLNLAVLSRFPLQNVTELDFAPLEGPGRPTRGLLRFELTECDAVSFLFYNLHLKSNWGDTHRNQSQRHNSMVLLREDWAAWADTQSDSTTWEVIVAGDFNVDPEHPSFADDPSLRTLDDMLDLWAGRSLKERITVPTRYGVPRLEFPPVAFDRFYVTPGLAQGPWVAGQTEVLAKGVNTADAEAVAGADEDMASDHYPVYLQLYRSDIP